MQITAIDGLTARCSARGVERDISLFLLQAEPVAPGDFVLIHVGYAIQKIDAEQAKESWDLFDQIADLNGRDGPVEPSTTGPMPRSLR